MSIGFDQDGRVAVQPRIIQIKLQISARDHHFLFMGEADECFGSIVGERLTESAAPEMGNQDGEITVLQTVEESRVEMIFVLVAVQMTTALRPILGKADTFLPTEKQFFMSHWGDCLKATDNGLKTTVR